MLRHALNQLKIKPQTIWDGIWRIVIFDIPNRHKWSRDALRGRLRIMGFYQLQKSVFVYPFPCDKEVAFIASLFNARSYLRLIKTDTIEHDDDLREFFGFQKANK